MDIFRFEYYEAEFFLKAKLSLWTSAFIPTILIKNLFLKGLSQWILITEDKNIFTGTLINCRAV